MRKIRVVAASIGAALATYQGARAADLIVFRDLHPARGEVLAISDAILATAFGAAFLLWLNLRATRTRLTSLEHTRIVLDAQLSVAAQIQRQLLPSGPRTANGVTWAARLEPADRIGGDFYDLVVTGAGVLFVVGDVSGKGIPAALLQASSHSLIRTLARETVQPAILLTRLSREIFAENAGGSYLTCVVVLIDSAAGTLTYANAGHPAGVLAGPLGLRVLSRGGPPAGLFARTTYEAEVVRIAPGDLGVIVTDGITEALDGPGAATADVLSSAIGRVPAPHTPERVCDALMALAQRGPGPRGVADWQDDKTAFTFLIDGQRSYG